MKWDPDSYLEFDEFRARPFTDLLARVTVRAPRRVTDLGCGPGNRTAELLERWPDAVVDALDSSPEMVRRARAAGIDARLGDVADWAPGPESDVVVCNAVLQWVPGHPELLARWIAALPAGAELAFQVPGNFGAPSHRLVRELLDTPRWRGRVPPRAELPVLEPREYGDLIAAAGARPDVWEVTYLHLLTGRDPVLAWLTGTALRPVRAALDDVDWADFRAELRPRLAEAYPVDQAPDGAAAAWFPFRRIFGVARRS
jgi:trans-aconitate 2-methyltransferase